MVTHTKTDDAVDAPVLASGDVVDGMTVIGVRKQGGFAHIYEARTADGARIALKVLMPQIANMRGVIERMRIEASALAALHHPHVVDVLACGEHAGRPYIAMEWLDGRSLAEDIMVRGALPVAMVLALFEQVCGAVAAAHARGIVHRDLKAHNIMLIARDPIAVKLVDFGIAKLINDPGPGITTSMQVIGSPIAMAPEQLLGGTIDERTDIYALGALLYHCLTGQPPFAGRNALEIEELHLSGQPPRASDVVAVPPALDAVIRRSMAKAQSARHPSVAAFLADLRDAYEPSTRRGAAVYIEADCDDDDDLDALDRAMIDAERVLRDAGLEIFAEASNALLAGATLPGTGDELVRRALEAALTIARPRLRIRIRAAVDVLVGTTSELGPRAVTGLPAGVVATATALAAKPELTGEPVADGMFRVVQYA
jgi:serine/threonine-protein kinase